MIEGVALSGGRSSRFGSDKAVARIGDRTMLEIALANLSEVCDKVAVSVGDRSRDCSPYIAIPDLRSDCGPIAGIEAAMEQSEADRLLFTTCDMPLISPRILRKLIDEYDRSKGAEATAYITPAGELKVFPLLIAKSVLPRLSLFLYETQKSDAGGKGRKGGKSVRRFLERISLRPVPLEEDEVAEFINVNTVRELSSIAGQASSG